jgi:hypothetical protein
MKGFTTTEVAIVLAIIVLLVIVVAGAIGQVHDQDAFMADCTQHEPKYTCQVKWKQMHPDPVVVYAPLNK